MDSVLLSNLVERLHPSHRFHPNLRLELRAVHRALLALTHAIILLGQQLKPVSRIWGPLYTSQGCIVICLRLRAFSPSSNPKWNDLGDK